MKRISTLLLNCSQQVAIHGVNFEITGTAVELNCESGVVTDLKIQVDGSQPEILEYSSDEGFRYNKKHVPHKFTHELAAIAAAVQTGQVHAA